MFNSFMQVHRAQCQHVLPINSVAMTAAALVSKRSVTASTIVQTSRMNTSVVSSIDHSAIVHRSINTLLQNVCKFYRNFLANVGHRKFP